MADIEKWALRSKIKMQGMFSQRSSFEVNKRFNGMLKFKSYFR